ncbi:hypothetical protein D3C71_1601480 [compost metagenome]
MLRIGSTEVVAQRPAILLLDELAQLPKGHLGVQLPAFVDPHVLGQGRDLLGVQLQQQADQKLLAAHPRVYLRPGQQARPKARAVGLRAKPGGQ